MFAVDTTDPPRWAEVQPMWKYSNDIPDAFFPALYETCARIGCRPQDMVGCWTSESGLSPRAHNPGGDAAGLFQAMPATLRGIGFHGQWSDFVKLSIVEQLKWAERYYAPYRGMLVSPGACYLATFLPAYMPHANDPAFVLCSERIHPEWYRPNKILDVDGNGDITIQNLTDRIASVETGPRWAEVSARITQAIQDADTFPTGPDVSTTRGQQCAYNRLGYPCTVDGIEGNETRGACRSFQGDHDLTTDGVCGPLTQTALEIALSTAD